MMENNFWTPAGIHGAEEDPLAERRRRIAQQIRNNQEIPVSPSGELLDKDSSDAEKSSGFETPKGVHGAEEDPLAARRRRIAEQIRNNQEIPVSPSGELLDKDSSDAEKSSGFETPKGVHGAEEDPLAARRRRITEQIRNNQGIPVSPSGELLNKDSSDAEKSSGFETPKGVHGA